ncbi:hypothetical protein DPMN_030173 [Dreissena polymorpha]|uniref:Uncharacterized protein n=1 Tax=Dreissena polymorpha TaxID=45954 RepID=A0A9D4M0E7_DREPO|nr:hypothetical protein DPMN_030173 [Dreissena polymorpha]
MGICVSGLLRDKFQQFRDSAEEDVFFRKRRLSRRTGDRTGKRPIGGRSLMVKNGWRKKFTASRNFPTPTRLESR